MADDRVDVERYELFEPPFYRMGTGLLEVYGDLSPTRRDFIKTFGTGLLVLLVAPKIGAAQESGRGFGGANLPSDVASSQSLPARRKSARTSALP